MLPSQKTKPQDIPARNTPDISVNYSFTFINPRSASPTTTPNNDYGPLIPHILGPALALLDTSKSRRILAHLGAGVVRNQHQDSANLGLKMRHYVNVFLSRVQEPGVSLKAPENRGVAASFQPSGSKWEKVQAEEWEPDDAGRVHLNLLVSLI